jgi:hypothetical protein
MANYDRVKTRLESIAREAGLSYEIIRDMSLLEFIALYREVQRDRAAERAVRERQLELFRNVETLPPPAPEEV